MKSEVILDAIGKARDKYIEEAAPKEKRSKKYTWVKWIAAAACLILAVYAGIRFIPTGISGLNIPAGTGSLPMLTITSEVEGAGTEACLAYDISELDNGNPWTADTYLKTLPVYKNTAYDATGMAMPGIGKERMLELAGQAAEALDMKVTEVIYDTAGNTTKGSNIDEGVISSVVASTAAAKITATKNGTITVSFNEGIELPEEYSFTYANPSGKEADIVTDYLVERFSDFLSFNKPQKALFADYTYDGNLNRSYYVYDADGNITEQILNFNFNKAQFAPDDNENLKLIRKSNGLSCAEKIGDYPVITPAEALKLLLNGNYTSNVPEKMPGEEYVAKTELVYRTANTNETFLPYYRFWVELPDMQQENGLKTFSAYYVPAVQHKYISDMPLWDGSFN